MHQFQLGIMFQAEVRPYMDIEEWVRPVKMEWVGLIIQTYWAPRSLSKTCPVEVGTIGCRSVSHPLFNVV